MLVIQCIQTISSNYRVNGGIAIQEFSLAGSAVWEEGLFQGKGCMWVVKQQVCGCAQCTSAGVFAV